MRRATLVFVVFMAALTLVSCTAGSEGAGYDPTRDPAADLAAAVEEASGSGRRIMLEVGGEWCHWCHLLEEFFATHDEHRKLLKNKYVVVKVNYSPENENEAFLSLFPPFKGYPHIMILDSDGSHLHSQDTGALEKGQGYDPEAMKAFLEKWAG